jgi:hypothetical protein
MRASSSSRPRRRSAAALLLVGIATLLLISSPADAKRKGPIIFAGLKSATTCIAGPGRYPTSYHLEWEAARDRSTRSRKIVYNVYETTTPGGENFSKPSYTTDPGITSFDTPKLTNEDTYYFVVRARDKMGHEDSNTVERVGQNLCE